MGMFPSMWKFIKRLRRCAKMTRKWSSELKSGRMSSFERSKGQTRPKSLRKLHVLRDKQQQHRIATSNANKVFMTKKLFPNGAFFATFFANFNLQHNENGFGCA